MSFEHRDDIGDRLGMWIFIFTEILIFGGIFIVYAVYRAMYPTEFQEAAFELDTFMGTANTIVLLVSSMTVAMAISAVQLKNKTLAKRLILLTLVLAGAFLVNKYFEWGHKFEIGLYLNSDIIHKMDNGHTIFFGLYYFMTGLHGIHIIVGMILLAICYFKVDNGSINDDQHTLLVNSGLYWHLVDLIWIFLFPLLYLL